MEYGVYGALAEVGDCVKNNESINLGVSAWEYLGGTEIGDCVKNNESIYLGVSAWECLGGTEVGDGVEDEGNGENASSAAQQRDEEGEGKVSPGFHGQDGPTLLFWREGSSGDRLGEMYGFDHAQKFVDVCAQRRGKKMISCT